jgi:hypothetical protein
MTALGARGALPDRLGRDIQVLATLETTERDHAILQDPAAKESDFAPEHYRLG